MARILIAVLVTLGLVKLGLGNNIFDYIRIDSELESLARQNFHKRIITLLNHQINVHLNASHIFTAMANHFDRDPVALPGFYQYFHEASEFEQDQAQSLMRYMNKRGGKVHLGRIEMPRIQEWSDGLDAMTYAQRMSVDIFHSLMFLHYVADTPGKKRQVDVHVSLQSVYPIESKDTHVYRSLASVLEDTYLHHQIELIKSRAHHVTELTRVMKNAKPGLGEFIFDQRLR